MLLWLSLFNGKFSVLLRAHDVVPEVGIFSVGNGRNSKPEVKVKIYTGILGKSTIAMVMDGGDAYSHMP
ncbi:hypothetical protein SETIT_3G109000v2 [Setaria italica]|uniref:Uncharacterized protein n=2 Tax=Setaria TaxID=4554 RepID=A0A368QDX6_SETIT|nr:hypothetical protein SETIT_3G109000v2 [Setaria italica]TKW25322.1 hypothetical protein SEVIR_3G111500v2 [Setaria viridis]